MSMLPMCMDYQYWNLIVHPLSSVVELKHQVFVQNFILYLISICLIKADTKKVMLLMFVILSLPPTWTRWVASPRRRGVTASWRVTLSRGIATRSWRVTRRIPCWRGISCWGRGVSTIRWGVSTNWRISWLETEKRKKINCAGRLLK